MPPTPRKTTTTGLSVFLFLTLIVCFWAVGPTLSEIRERIDDERFWGITYVGPGSSKWEEDHPKPDVNIVPSSDETSTGGVNRANSRLTKDQWKARLGRGFVETGVIIPGVRRSAFVDRCGEPDRTETAGANVYWYYTCSDGEIQLVLAGQYLALGVIVVERTNDD